jgi:uncharacterized tellurite resistance protein B-like protein
MDYWPSYATITSQSRAAYLRWLAAGRRHRDVGIGYVFLFFYGLERRALYEWPHDRQAQSAELPLIRGEVDRLIRLFAGNTSFEGYARAFQEVLETIALLGSDVWAGPLPAPDRESPPMRLRLGLSGFATTGRPVPADWALSWLMSQPNFYPRTAITRCDTEFRGLFERRYAAVHGTGVAVRPRGKDITLDYRTASPGFRGPATLAIYNRPDVFGQAAPVRKLTELANQCTEALEAYSRFLGREPDKRGSTAAAALLPPELLDLESGEVREFIDWARSHLGNFAAVTVRADEFLAPLPPERPPRKKDIIPLLQLLGHANIGVEPDPRLGGPLPISGRVILFRADEGLSAAPSHAYQSAMLLLHLGAAVSVADGHVSVEEKEHLVGHLEGALHLSTAERTRLRAHLRWLLTTEVKLTGLTKRIAVLDKGQREHIADFLATVAAADGYIDPAEVTTLRRIRELLGLDPDQVHTSLHAASTAAAPPAATEPVVVREAHVIVGHAIPPQKLEQPAQEEPAPGQVRLDEAALAVKLAEAAEVALLLGDVFEDEARPERASPPLVAEPVAGLDGPHSMLLRALAERATISRADWEELSSAGRLLPDGALDRINEVAYETAGEPVAEGEDPILVNHYALGEML